MISFVANLRYVSTFSKNKQNNFAFLYKTKERRYQTQKMATSRVGLAILCNVQSC